MSISCLSVHETIKYATFRYGTVEVENGFYAGSLMLVLMLMSMFMSHAFKWISLFCLVIYPAELKTRLGA